LAAARAPLSAHFVVPGEALAAQEMLIAQFAISAMTFPFLLRDARCCFATILTSAPMLQLAGVLAGTSTSRIASVWTCLALWLAALSIWRSALPPRHRPLAVAIANLLTLGGVLVAYLSTEFHSGPSAARFLPLVASVRFSLGYEPIALPLLSTAFFASSGVIAALAARIVTHKRAVARA
jgi:hypothetical protein